MDACRFELALSHCKNNIKKAPDTSKKDRKEESKNKKDNEGDSSSAEKSDRFEEFIISEHET